MGNREMPGFSCMLVRWRLAVGEGAVCGCGERLGERVCVDQSRGSGTPSRTIGQSVGQKEYLPISPSARV